MSTAVPAPAAPAAGDPPGGGDVLVDVRGLKVHFPIKRGVILDRTVGYVYAVDGMDMTCLLYTSRCV